MLRSEISLDDAMGTGGFHHRQICIVGLCIFMMFLEGYDMYLLGVLLPALAKDFGVEASQMAAVIVAQQAGVVLGAFVAGPTADRIGRRWPLIICTTLFGLATLATLWTESASQLAILRFIAGLFLSGIFPNAVALSSEYSPKASRTRVVTLVLTGYVVGSAASGLITAWLLSVHGWQGAFFVGAILPLLLVPALIAWLPESLHFLASRDAADKRIASGLLRMGKLGALNGTERFILPESVSDRKAGVLATMFSEGRTPITLALWTSFALTMSIIVFLAFWMPAFFHELRNVPVASFAAQSAVGAIGSIASTATAGSIMTRWGSYRIIALYACLAGVVLIGLGAADFGTLGFTMLLIGWSFFMAGAQAGLNALAASLYPTHARSTAISWSIGTGRLVSIGASGLGGGMLAAGWSLLTIFSMIAALLCILALLMAILARCSAKANLTAASGTM